MAPRLALDYGRRPYPVELPAGSRIVCAPTPSEAPPSLEFLMESALDNPVGSARLEERVRTGMRVALVVSDSTRAEPRDALIRAAMARMPGEVTVEVAVATGTHGPCRVEDLGIGADLAARVDRFVMHDGADAGSLVAIGRTRRGTPVTVNRAVVDADLVVATGCIIPHYFAGYGAGVKAIFPGLGGAREVRINHELKAEPGARAGVVDGNPCREDLEEALDFLPAAPFLLNAVVDDDGHARAAVAGDVRGAFRAGAARCAPLYTVRSPRARTVVVSGRGPITASLYQASKLVAAAAPLVEEGGTIALVAECWLGTGPLEIVNRGIFEIGIRPRLPAGCRVVLVSSLDADVVAKTCFEYAPSLDAVLARGADAPLVLPRAGSLLCEAVDQ
jgi:nickel-dependent lactate racemase